MCEDLIKMYNRTENFHNVMVCEDLIKMYNRKGISPRCMMKQDLKKAYDSVRRGFVEELSSYMCFSCSF